MMKYRVAPLFPAPDGRPATGEPPVATLVRWTFDPKGSSDSFSETPLDEHPGEFPRLDERYTALPYRHGWFQAGLITDARRGRADAPEGDGFVLSVVFRAETQCSDLAVFDAQNLADGPLALAHLSHRVPAGSHGNWRDAA